MFKRFILEFFGNENLGKILCGGGVADPRIQDKKENSPSHQIDFIVPEFVIREDPYAFSLLKFQMLNSKDFYNKNTI